MKNNDLKKRSTLGYSNPMAVSRSIKSGVLSNAGFGYYSISPKQRLTFDSDETFRIINSILDSFPIAPRRVLFSSASLNFCINQQISSTTYIVEVEKDYVMSSFLLLRERLSARTVLLSPKRRERENYWTPKAIYVYPLFSRSPNNELGTMEIEKLIVDLLTDERIFSLYSGIDVQMAINTLCARYDINYQTLFAYAQRKGKKEYVYQSIEKYIPKEIKDAIHDQ